DAHSAPARRAVQSDQVWTYQRLPNSPSAIMTMRTDSPAARDRDAPPSRVSPAPPQSMVRLDTPSVFLTHARQPGCMPGAVLSGRVTLWPTLQTILPLSSGVSVREPVGRIG